ncbi:hypothetical protein GZ77_04725 [Endozoicomonas montiporae]|uniref:Uncharacterized protein n=2 Tax=Endozoicomonas montiporae TaxID=1027273 RepID=A0A081NBK5_9GAMM|nr:hypothetical protein [Endozoicomonas montiporae]AMO56118.1 hypothetical protein EZMO1_1995 [Endozoicomonas montiporae CL-33]KEQ15828.1 hypothetical protein GZ77_04725 [Endozoicomonas montiporae]
MNPHFLEKCMYASLFEEKEEKLRMIRGMVCNKKMADQFNEKCIGLATKDPHRLKTDFLISETHPLLLNNIQGLQAKKLATGLRETYIKRNMVMLEKRGLIPLIKANFNLESVIPFVDGSVKILVDSNNTIIIPYVLSYQDWLEVAKQTYPDEFHETSTRTRLRAVFKTIRHSMGIYDAAWQKLPTKCYGYICRRMVQMVCKRFSLLDTVAKEWLEQKAKVTDVDQFELDTDWVVGSDKFYWLPDELAVK